MYALKESSVVDYKGVHEYKKNHTAWARKTASLRKQVPTTNVQAYTCTAGKV